MGSETAIEWTDATWNPWRGCDKVSPGCAHCYMFTAQRRYGRDPAIVVRAADPTFYEPLRSKAWRRLPFRAKVFTCSWSDWFHEDADAWRDEAWDIIRQRPDLTFQILTKRPERILEHLPADWGDAGWRHVWLGVSIENRRYVHRADQLRAVPAVVRFISAEPLLGPLLAAGHIQTFTTALSDDGRMRQVGHELRWGDAYEGPELDLEGIDWLIAGGESGPGHRPISERWVRDLHRACIQTDTAFFLKQWGGARPGGPALLDGHPYQEFPPCP